MAPRSPSQVGGWKVEKALQEKEPFERERGREVEREKH